MVGQNGLREALQALADNLTNTWYQSGWLQGALVFAALPLPLKAKEKVKAIRATAERALIEQNVNDWLRDPEFTDALHRRRSPGAIPAGDFTTLWRSGRYAVARTVRARDRTSLWMPLIEALFREPGIGAARVE